MRVTTERIVPSSVRVAVSAQAARLDWYQITFLSMLLRVLGRRTRGIRTVNGVGDHPILQVIA